MKCTFKFFTFAVFLFCTFTSGAFAQFSCAELTAPDWDARWHRFVTSYYERGGSAYTLQDMVTKITNQQKVCFEIEESKARLAHEQQQQAPQNTPSNLGFDGNWWVSASPNERGELLVGFVKGVKLALETLCVRPLAEAKTLDQHAYDACIETFKKENPILDYTNNDKLFAGVDGFYKDADNKKLDIEYAVLYVKSQQAGLSIKALDDELAGWRKEVH